MRRRYNRRMGEPAIGSTLGGYRIDALIARGGMGVVYRATQLALERPVALKVIASHLAEEEQFRERFLSESRLAASLDHPNVVPVYDAREEDGELIVAMRLIGGGDLKRRIRAEGPLPPAQAIELLGQVASALDAAHAAGIVHRDVKPHNVLLEGRDRAFLSDFGLAKALGESGALSEASIAGTVEYMSPEQWRGGRVGPAADVYSLGCVLYEALTGVVPYARGAEDSGPEMPRGLDAVIERAVDKDPERRYASAGELIEAARERQGATPAATRVLTGEQRTIPLHTGAPMGSGRPGAAGLWAWARARPLRWIAAPLVALAAIAVAVALLLGGGDVSVSAPIAVAEGPLRIAAGAGSVWVTSEPEGTLSRIDPSTGEVNSRFHLGPGLSGVAVAAGSVWVSQSSTGKVLRIDPATGRPLDEIHLGSPGAIVAGGNRIWVADEDGAGITAINVKGGRVFRRGIVPHVAPLRLGVGAGGLWVVSPTTGTVRRIDLGSAVPGPSIAVGRGPSGVTVAGGIVWVANSRSDSVTRLDPATHTLLGEPIKVGERPGGIDAGTDSVWVANSAEGTVNRIDIDSGKTVGGPIGVGSEPGAVAIGGEAVWVADNGDGAVTRIEP
jgi:DNA-binding beta-propeller fold protein YncE